ncbi:MAG: transcriptional repressor LexA [Clostridia bacterium]|nr:transcriptional repressor LexA [Clostridia bacterium]
MQELTEMQSKIYEYIKSEIKKGITPSIREICKAVGLSSTSSIHYHLDNLEQMGYISRPKSKKRCIEILENDFYMDSIDTVNTPEYSNVPIIGSVAAGLPILAEENIEGYFPVPITYLTNDKTFMLRIKGNSMINAGILNNDLVLVKQTTAAKDGEIIIALIDDSATCKTFYKENEYIRLQPENDSYEPIYVRDCNIIGKVIGLFRSY